MHAFRVFLLVAGILLCFGVAWYLYRRDPNKHKNDDQPFGF